LTVKQCPSVTLVQRIRHYVEYVVIRILICIIQILPFRVCERMAGGLAYLVNDWLKCRQHTVEENLQGVYPRLSAAARQDLSRKMWQHLLLMVFEMAHVHRTIHEATWRRYIKIANNALLNRYFLDGRPLVMVSGHFGNFEIASYIAGLLGITGHAVGKPIGNPHLDKFVRQFRQARGQYLLPYNDSAVLIEALLKKNQIFTLLGDQHAGRRGVWVEFFGRPAACHKALALFTLSHNAPMLVNYAIRQPGRPMHFEIGCVAVADPEDLSPHLRGVKELTQWYNQQLESMVRQYPEQYWWLHRRWKEQPRRRRRRVRKVA